MATGVAQPITIEQLASMTPSDQQAYVAGLPADQQAVVQAQLAQVNKRSLMQAGADYMARTIDKEAICVMTNGGALSQSWPAGGGLLSFTVPQTLNGWLRGYKIRLSLTVTNAAGTSAVYALTAGGVLGLIQQVTLWYGNNQQQFPLRVLLDYYQLQGQWQQNPWQNVPAIGRNTASIDTYLSGGNSFPVATGANSWTVEVFVPCNWVHLLDVRGMLPISGGQTQPTITLLCNSAPFGADPMKNVLYAVSGTGHATTITGTVSVYAVYRDGDSLGTRQKLALSVGNLGTMQAFYDGTLNQLTANQTQPYQLIHIGRHYTVLAYVIDAQASQTFCATTNISQIDVVKDAAGSNILWRAGGDTNLDIREWFATRIRAPLGQDLQEGVIPFVFAQGSNTVNIDNTDGIDVFDNTPGNGWPAAQFRVKVGAVGALGSGPRVEYYTIFENPQGLVVIG